MLCPLDLCAPDPLLGKVSGYCWPESRCQIPTAAVAFCSPKFHLQLQLDTAFFISEPELLFLRYHALLNSCCVPPLPPLCSPTPSPQVAAVDNVSCRINLSPIEVSGNSASVSQIWLRIQLVKHFQLLQEKRCSAQPGWLATFISRGGCQRERKSERNTSTSFWHHGLGKSLNAALVCVHSKKQKLIKLKSVIFSVRV